MDILLEIGLWILIFIVLLLINPFLITLISLPFSALAGNIMEGAGHVIMPFTTAVGTYIAFVFIYSYLWLYFFNSEIPILFYIIYIISVWFGSGTDQVEATYANKLMMRGELTTVIILMGIALKNGVNFI